MRYGTVRLAVVLTLIGIVSAEVAAGQMASDEVRVFRPGDTAIEGRRIAPYDVVWVQYFDTEEGRTLRRTATDQVERVSVDGRDVLVRTQVFLGLDGIPTSERVNRIDGETLRPLHEQWEWPDNQKTHVDYDGNRVSGAMIAVDPGESAIVFDERLAEPGFDFNVVPLLLASLHLSPGMEFEFPHVQISPPGYNEPELVRALFQVQGREQVDAGPLGEVEAWRVVEPEHEMVFWIVETAPYLVRLEWPVEEGTLSVMELGTVTLPGATSP